MSERVLMPTRPGTERGIHPGDKVMGLPLGLDSTGAGEDHPPGRIYYPGKDSYSGPPPEVVYQMDACLRNEHIYPVDIWPPLNGVRIALILVLVALTVCSIVMGG